MKTIFLTILISLALVGCNQLTKTSTRETPQSDQTQTVQINNVEQVASNEDKWIAQGDFSFNQDSHDFGVVKQSDGKVSTEFKVKYTGQTQIEVTGLPTSCACTSGELSQMKFEPGDEAILTVTFNANLHPEPTERFFRTVTFLTQPELEPLPEVRIWIEHIEDLGQDKYEIPAHDD